MIPPTKRLHYFNYQFLRVEDFTDEQEYHLGMRRAHNRLLHTPGVAQGLVLGRDGAVVTVSPGVALDGQGREIVLDAEARLEVQELTGTTAWVTIAYGERRTDVSTETGSAGERRWEEVPSLYLRAQAPPAATAELVLGRVSVDAQGNVAGVDDGQGDVRRRVAGPAPGAELSVRSLDVRQDAGVAGTLRVGAPGSGVTLTPGGVGIGAAPAAGTALTVGTVLAVGSAGVGIGTAPAAGTLLSVAGVLDATELRQNGLPVFGSQWATVAGGISYTNGNVGIGTSPAAAGAGALTVAGALAAGGATGLTVTGTGRVGIGVSSPEFALDVSDRVRLRGTGSSSLSAGLWLYQRGLNTDRAFIGMKNDNLVGIAGTTDWQLQMDVASGNVGIRREPAGDSALAVRGSVFVDGLVTTSNGLTVNGNAPLNLQYGRIESVSEITIRPNTDNIGATAVKVLAPNNDQLLFLDGSGNLTVSGRVSDVRTSVSVPVHNAEISISSTNKDTDQPVWEVIQSLSVASHGGRFLIRFHIAGVEARGAGISLAVANFRLRAAGEVVASAQETFKADLAWSARGVSMEALVTLAAGSRSIVAEWAIRSPQALARLPGSPLEVRVYLYGCLGLSTRNLIAIEL